jgi:hypothetical protein
MVWLAVVLGVFALFWTPLMIALIRDVESIGLVVLLTLLALATGVMWVGALIAAFMLPKKPRPRTPYPPTLPPRGEYPHQTTWWS